jgi:hypothetical protein
MSDADSDEDASIRFTNDLASRKLIETLTASFERLTNAASSAIEPDVALAECVATANAVFAALPLPPDNVELKAAALAAHQQHLALLRTLIDLDVGDGRSRRTYNRRVSDAHVASMASRDSMLFAAAKASETPQSRAQFPTAEAHSKEVADFLVGLFGGPRDASSPLMRSDIAAAATRNDSYDTLLEFVGKHYEDLATERASVWAAKAPTVREPVHIEPVEQLLDLEKTHFIGDETLDKFGEKETDEARASLRASIISTLVPGRGRFGGGQFAIQAARLRAHPQNRGAGSMENTVLSETRPQLDSSLQQYRAEENIFYTVIRKIFQSLADGVNALDNLKRNWRLRTDDRKILLLEARKTELLDRRQKIEDAPSQDKPQFELVQQFLEADKDRAAAEDSTFSLVRYEDQLRAVTTAEQRLRSLPTDYDEQTTYTDKFIRDMKNEVERIDLRIKLRDAVDGILPLSPEDQKAAAEAEIEDRLYESAEDLKTRLEGYKVFANITIAFNVDGKLVVNLKNPPPPPPISVPAPTPPPVTPPPLAPEIPNQNLSTLDTLTNVLLSTITTPTAGTPRVEPTSVPASVGAPGLPVVRDPALDDGAVWKVGFERFSPHLVELLFTGNRVYSEADRIGRFLLLGSYVKSVGTINRRSVSGIRAETTDKDFGVIVDGALAKKKLPTLDQVAAQLIKFASQEDKEREAELTDAELPEILEVVPARETDLSKRALLAIDVIIDQFRRNSLETAHRQGDVISVSQLSGGSNQVNSIRINVAPDTDMTEQQRERALVSLNNMTMTVLPRSTSALLAVPDDIEVARSLSEIGLAFRNLTLPTFSTSNRLDGSSRHLQTRGLVTVARRYPGELIDPSFKGLFAEIEYRANSTDASLETEDAIDRIISDSQTKLLRTITRVEVIDSNNVIKQMVVDDVFRYAEPKDIRRFQLIDIHDSATVTVVLRNATTNIVESRIIDRVVFGAPPDSNTTAERLLDSIRHETAASAVGKSLGLLVNAIFLRSRMGGASRATALATTLQSDESVITKLLQTPTRLFGGVRSLYDALAVFAYETNFAPKALLALTCLYANINYLVMLFGVACLLWPAIAVVLQRLGVVDALARAFFEALKKVVRVLGSNMEWTLASHIIGIIEKMSHNAPNAGGARREAALIRRYMETMRASGRSPRDALPTTEVQQTFMDRVYEFARVYGNQSDLYRKTFNGLWARLMKVFVDLNKATSGLIAVVAYIFGGNGMGYQTAGGGFGLFLSYAVLGTLNVFSTVLVVYSYFMMQAIPDSFFHVFAISVATRAAAAAVGGMIAYAVDVALLPEGRSRARPERVRLADTIQRGIQLLSAVGPDAVAYLTGTEYFLTGGYGWDPVTRSMLPTALDNPRLINTYLASFAGRESGRLAGGLAARSIWSLVRFLNTDQDDAIHASADDDALDLVGGSELDNKTSLELMALALRAKSKERIVWTTLLFKLLAWDVSRLVISLDHFNSNKDNRYLITSPESFLVAKNFMLEVFHHHELLPLSIQPITALARIFVSSRIEQTHAAATSGFQKRRDALFSVAQSVLLKEKFGEVLEKDEEEPLYDTKEKVVTPILGTKIDGHRVSQSFYFQTTRLKEFPTILDRMLLVEGASLINIGARTPFVIAEEDEVTVPPIDQFITRMLAFYISGQLSFVGILLDVDVKMFALEVVGYGSSVEE